jgi:pSer/pThr/pTyr-binding forkhead associated (FHA) protein|tara:strand:- start:424 stop:822 length:399 start_codon:yes stop_codon:yes gene_type:complete
MGQGWGADVDCFLFMQGWAGDRVGAYRMNIVCTFLGKTKSVSVPHTLVTIGRKSSKGMPELDLSEDKSVSRKHAKIWEEEGEYWIEDLGSRLGTWVNGLRRTKIKVKFGDRITVGKTMLQLMPSNVGELSQE